MWKQSSVLKRYLKSYIGIVMLCCITISVAFSFIMAEAGNNAYLDSLDGKNAALMLDFDQQLRAMESIGAAIASSSAFNGRLLSRGRYYEIEMLKELAKYRDISPIADLVFIIYENDPNRVFYASRSKAEAYTSDTKLFLKLTLGTSEPDLVQAQILESNTNTYIHHSENGLLLTMTVSPVSVDPVATKIKLCFRIPNSRLVERMFMVTGFSGEYFRLIFGNECIVSTLSNEALSSEAPMYDFYYPKESDAIYSIFVRFKNIGLFASLIEMVVFVIVACAAAYSSYAPIRAAAYKFVKTNYVGSNELSELELMLQDAYDSLRLNQISDIKNSRRLRSAQLLLAFMGVESGDKQLLVPQNYENVLYRVFCVDIDFLIAESIIEQIDGYTENNFVIYTCARNVKYGVGILTCFSDMDAGADAMKMIHEIFEALETEYTLGVSSVGNDISTLYKEAISNLDAQIAALKQLDIANSPVVANEIMEYAKEHMLDWDFSLSKLAANFGCSASAMSARFKEAASENFKDWLTNQRIALAKHLLTETTLSVSKICEEVGYGNISHFIKTFKHATGVTPGDWRNSESKGL